jgi:hypothetical protein
VDSANDCVFPDYSAPVVRNAGAERELIMMRWGMPPPPRTGGPPVTNIRNTSSAGTSEPANLRTQQRASLSDREAIQRPSEPTSVHSYNRASCVQPMIRKGAIRSGVVRDERPCGN